MKKFIFWTLFALLSLSLGKESFSISSQDLPSGKYIEGRFLSQDSGCKGDNLSPSIQWRDAPAGTKSFAIMMYDPSANVGAGFVHWLVFKIPAGVQSLKQGAGDSSGGALPRGAVQAVSSTGQKSYSGPCLPKPGIVHTLELTIYALKIFDTGLTEYSSPSEAKRILEANTLAKATLKVLHSRNK